MGKALSPKIQTGDVCLMALKDWFTQAELNGIIEGVAAGGVDAPGEDWSSQLHTLRMARNKLEAGGMRAIAEALSVVPQPGRSFNTTLTYLDVSSCHAGAAGIFALATMIRSNQVCGGLKSRMQCRMRRAWRQFIRNAA